jgi:hypothetical protein
MIDIEDTLICFELKTLDLADQAMEELNQTSRRRSLYGVVRDSGARAPAGALIHFPFIDNGSWPNLCVSTGKSRFDSE